LLTRGDDWALFHPIRSALGRPGRGAGGGKKVVTPDELDRLFRWLSTSLGSLQKCEPSEGHALMSATTQSGKMISAEYTAKATFEKGDATVILNLIKHSDQWQILRFDVHSPQLVPR